MKLYKITFYLLLEPCCAYTLQRASWLLPIVDSGKDEERDIIHWEIVAHLNALQRKINHSIRIRTNKKLSCLPIARPRLNETPSTNVDTAVVHS